MPTTRMHSSLPQRPGNGTGKNPFAHWHSRHVFGGKNTQTKAVVRQNLERPVSELLVGCNCKVGRLSVQIWRSRMRHRQQFVGLKTLETRISPASGASYT